MLPHLERPVKGHITEDRGRKKAQHKAGFEPTNIVRCALYNCTTTAAHVLIIRKC